jgi:hydrogenase expression/formation protein HypE
MHMLNETGAKEVFMHPGCNTILMAHGSGGRLTHELIEKHFLPHFTSPALASLADAALVAAGSQQLLFTTDSFVVTPLFFPGGDIGKLAVCGTVNDLAVMGGIPLYLSCAFIIEEGFSLETLERVVCSMKNTADEAGVQVVTGDTKVVERGHADRLFITTSGVGIPRRNMPTGDICPGDALLINGFIGDHGAAVFASREDLALESPLSSDCAPLNRLTGALLDGSVRVKFMRDPTRGGLATVANEIAGSSGVALQLEEAAIPVREEVTALCDLMGFDPLYLANEGKVLLVVHGDDVGKALEIMRQLPEGRDGCRIGEIIDTFPGKVLLRTAIGGTRIVDMLTGDQLPRIC